MSAGFKISCHAGFRMTFENGYSISVQWGHGTYSENEQEDPFKSRGEIFYHSKTAEVAIIKDDEFIRSKWNEDDDIITYASPNTVLDIMNWVAVL